MNTSSRFKWIDFYTDFATQLLKYKEDRRSLIQKIQKVYSSLGMKMPKLERGDVLEDIDPFTIFGLFNKKMTDSDRKLIIHGLISEFAVSAEVPDEFSGIPVLQNRWAAFYAFEDMRQEHDIDNLWSIFSAALALADEDTPDKRERFSKAYNQVLTQATVRWKLTIGLYWVRPYRYLYLDACSRRYMSNPATISANIVADISALKTVPSAEKYLELCDKCSAVLSSGKYAYKSFPELSYHARIVSEEDKQQEKEGKPGRSNAPFLRWFKPVIQALRDLGGSALPADTRKKIIENEKLTNTEVSETRGRNHVNKFENEVAFARRYLVSSGYIDNSVSGIWKLTEAGMTVDMTPELASEIFKNVAASMNAKKTAREDALGDADVDIIRYWLYAPGEGASMWDEFYQRGIMGLGWHELGNLNTYTSKKEMSDKLREVFGGESSYKNSVHAVWQFVHDLKPGDIVFAKRGRTEILGRGVIESDYEFDENCKDAYPNIRKVKWTHKGSWQRAEMFAMKTLTDISDYPDSVNKISALFEDAAEDEEKIKKYPPYTMEDFLEDVYMNETSYNTLVGILQNKMNIILQGAPGVGKTYLAKRLAYSVMGMKDVERVMMIQFHQSYSYEDFIMGFRPSATGFELKKGAFYNFCKYAEIDSERDYFFIIDEINRGNLSKIFGELFMLIENDKRGSKNKVQLLYSEEMFYVPENVYIIGMMNTADRSLAMLDYALRRRFAFIDLKPGFSSEGFRAYKAELDNRKFDKLIQCVENLNEHIAADESLGDSFCIGHSYFCGLSAEEVTDEKLSSIVEYELIPMLKEYWFDEPFKVREWSENLRSAVK